MGHARVAQDDADDVFLQLALAEDLHRRHRDAFLEDLPGVDGQGARHLAADVGHVAEVGGPAEVPAVLEDRLQDQPVVEMAHRGPAAVGVVGEDHVAFFEHAVKGFHEPVDERAELADHHLALDVGDHGEGIALLPDAGRHGRAEQRGVHFHPGVAKGVLDDVEGHRVHVKTRERRIVGLEYSSCHERAPQSIRPSGRMSRFPNRSTSAR